MERICSRCGIHVVIPKGEDLRICPKCKGLLVDGTYTTKLMQPGGSRKKG